MLTRSLAAALLAALAWGSAAHAQYPDWSIWNRFGGYSRPNIFGGYDYCRPGRTFFSSRPNIFGGYDYSFGGHSRPNIFGGYDYYLPGGRTFSSRPNVFGGFDYFGD
jgi:hypothetical protein